MSFGKPNKISFTGSSSSSNKTGGRFGDSLIAFMSPEQQTFLEQQGAFGTINPDTGLPEYLNPYEQQAYAAAVQGQTGSTQSPPANGNSWGSYEGVGTDAGSATMESAPVPNFDTMAAVQPSLTPETINGQTAAFESVGNSSGATASGLISSNVNTNTSGGNIQFANTDSGNIEGASSDGGMATFESVANTDQASTTALANSGAQVANSDFANNMNGLIDFLTFALNPSWGVGMGVGKMIGDQFGLGAGFGLGPSFEFETDAQGNNSFNAGLSLGGGIGVTHVPTGLGLPVAGQEFASVGLNFGADGVSTYTSGLEGSATSGDSNSNTGTSITYDNAGSTAGELAATDGETTFGNSATNEGGPAHINPSEYASLQAAGYTPPILSSNFGNFDDIQYVNPNAPV